MWYIHPKTCHPALEKEDILQYVTTWMNLEDSIRSEISQSQQIPYDSTCMMYLVKLMETEAGRRLLRDRVTGEWGVV